MNGHSIALLMGALCLFSEPPARADAAGENVVRNSSFEVGTDGYGILRGEYLTAGLRDVLWLPPTLVASTAYDGPTSLRIDNLHSGS